MTATNICYNFVGFRCSPRPVILKFVVHSFRITLNKTPYLYSRSKKVVNGFRSCVLVDVGNDSISPHHPSHIIPATQTKPHVLINRIPEGGEPYVCREVGGGEGSKYMYVHYTRPCQMRVILKYPGKLTPSHNPVPSPNTSSAQYQNLLLVPDPNLAQFQTQPKIQT